MEKKMILEQPMEIEKKSFSIIEEHLQGVTLPDAERSILKRVIHTTADFDYIQNLVFSKTAVSINVHCKSWAEQHIVSWQMKK